MPARRPMTRRQRGLSLFSGLLALVVFGVLVLGVSRWVEDRLQEGRDHRAAGQLAILATATHAWALDMFPDLLAGPPSREIALAQLRAADVLGPAFTDRDSSGRGYRILVMRRGAGTIDILVTQTVAPGDGRWPWRAAAAAPVGIMRIGTVPRDAPTRLRGPAIDVDVTPFQGAFGAPAERAMAAWGRLDRETVFGSHLYRVEVAGFPEINRMETDLDMGGNEITNAADIAARTITVDTALEVGGSLTVIGDLLVGRSVTVTGAVDLTGDLTAVSATIHQAASAASVTATGAARAGALTVTGEVDAGTIGSSGPMTISGGATMAGLTATSVAAHSVSATTVTATQLDAGQVTASGTMTAANAGISRLTVGACNGC